MYKAPTAVPLKVCPYAEKCYRKNPIHFGEYSHSHLDAIYEKGPDPHTNEYDIPKDLPQETILQQLRLLEKLFPKPNRPQRNAAQNTMDQSTSYTPGFSGTSKSVDANGDDLAKLKRSKCNSPTSGTSASAATSASNFHLEKKYKLTRNIKDYIPVVVTKGLMAEKWKRAAPYYMFLTAITDSKPTHNEPLSITLQEIFDESLGEIESTVQINFMIDISWLLGHYYFAGIIKKPLLVLYGDNMPELSTISEHQPQVKTVQVKMPTNFGISHAKIMLLGYKDGSMRVVVSTANLYEDDWHNRTQGLWISPRCAALPDDADTTAGESPTNFRQDLMQYLKEYKISQLQPWLARIRSSDFSAINVFFIGSVPGSHREEPREFRWGHARLGGLLKKHSPIIDSKIPIVCQSSSIGSLGPSVEAWIQHDILNSMRKDTRPIGVHQMPSFKMIYPSVSNVMSSHDGMLGGGCLPYQKSNNDRQLWLKTHLQQWRSAGRYRSRAMPHIKSYTRYSLEDQCVYWFVLTSANLSKAAWGQFSKPVKVTPSLRILSYEAGVLFLPKFVTGEETFPLGAARNGVPAIPLPYDVPLTPYGPDDKPFLMDYLQMEDM